MSLFFTVLQLKLLQKHKGSSDPLRFMPSTQCPSNYFCGPNEWLTNYFNGLFVVKFFVPVEHPEEREWGEQDEAYSKKHVACEAGKVYTLQHDKEGEEKTNPKKKKNG